MLDNRQMLDTAYMLFNFYQNFATQYIYALTGELDQSATI